MGIKSNQKVMDQVDEFVQGLNVKFARSADSWGSLFEADVLSKRVRIVRRSLGPDSRPIAHSGSAYCFVDEDGLIYKPNSWTAPAKGPRGSMEEGIPALVDRADAFGGWLYKNH